MSMFGEIRPDYGLPSDYRKKVVEKTPVPDHPNRTKVLLECGHIVTVFGNMDLLGNLLENGVICLDCERESSQPYG